MKHLSHEGIFGQGIQTFMRSPCVSISELKSLEADVAFIGVPLDYGASYRRGASGAPAAIRKHSYWDSVNGSEYVFLADGSARKTNKLSIVDLGDVHVSPSAQEDNMARIRKAVSDARGSCFPLVVGGDHSIAYATIPACKAALPKNMRERFGVLHLDAHFDMENEYLDLPRVFHGNPFRKLFEEGVIDPTRHFCIGQRGAIPNYLYEFVRKSGVSYVPSSDVKRAGVAKAIERMRKHLKERCDAVYVTLDIDVISPSEACGTGTPLEGGLSVEEVCEILRSLNDLPVVGLELVEVAPSLDPSGLTSVMACNLLWNFLAFGLRQPRIP